MKINSLMLGIVLIILPVSGYNTDTQVENENVAITYKISSLSPEEQFEQIRTKSKIEILFQQINAPGLSYKAFETAAIGYFNLQKKQLLQNDSLLSIVDLSQISNNKRFYILDIKNARLIHQTYVAHGTNTGSHKAQYFSNRIGSNQSSLGFYITNEVYMGRQGYSLKLDGVDGEFNSNARVRGVVVHGANYVSENFIKTAGRLGRSFGCPAVPTDENKMIIKMIKDKSCMYIYYPDTNYFSQSSLLNSGLYRQG